MSASKRKDIDKSHDHPTTPSGKAKEASPRLSDLVRESTDPSQKAVATPPPRPPKPSDAARKRKHRAATPPVQSSVDSEDGRLERAALAPQEASIERAIIERNGLSDRPHLKGLDAPDQQLDKATGIVREILRAVKAQTPFSISSGEEAAKFLLQNLQAGDALLVPVFTPGGPSLDPALEAVNVCLLAVKFGLELGYTREELRQLSLAALLHDVGMARLPEGLVEKNGPLNPVERASLGRHSEEGAQIIMGLGSEYSWLAEVIIQCHERVDGSGYPKALKGTEVHEYAQVVGLADVYESLVHHRPFRRRLSPLEALKEILSRERTAFPDRVLKALIQALSPYPVGSLVRLNTGEIGRVVAKDKDRPLRPVVEVLVRGGKRLEESMVTDLSQSPLLNIQDSLAEETLA